MTCTCGRVNDPHRCYCGGCGTRIAGACTRCRFVNALDDGFCGGCGAKLTSAVRMAAPPPARPTSSPAPTAAAPPRSADAMSATELAGLLGQRAVPKPVALPPVVSQDDLDRLFGEPT